MTRGANGFGGKPGPWTFLLVVGRPVATIALLVAAYYVLPLDRPKSSDLWLLILGLIAVVVLLAWNIRRISQSQHPTAQGIETLALVIPLYLLIFAAAYVLVVEHRPSSFSAPMTRTDALYFAVTVFTTVGFGDITPVTQSARVLVTCQMVADLLVLGVVLQVVVAAVKRARAASSPDTPAPDTAAPDSPGPDSPGPGVGSHPTRTMPRTAAADSVDGSDDESDGGKT